MQCRTHNRPQCCSINHSTASHQSVESGSGSRSAWRNSIPHGIDLHTHAHTEVRTYWLTLSILLPCFHVLHAFALPFLASSCSSAQGHAHPGVPCHATPMPCPAAPMPQPGRAQSSQSSIDISSVSCPALPTIGSQTRLHLGFRTSPTQASCAPRPLPCPVLQSRCPTCPASLSICKSASLSLPRDLVSVCDARFDSLCLLCFAFQCFALPCWPLLA